MSTIHIYPTSAEINKFAANGWRPITPGGLLRRGFNTGYGADRYGA
jgi:hypothetical protein